MQSLIGDFTQEEKGRLVGALISAFRGLHKRETLSEAEVEGIVYTRIRAQLGSLVAPKAPKYNNRYKGQKKHLKERLGPTKWRTFMQLYRAAREEVEDQEENESEEVILARMQMLVNDGKLCNARAETINRSAEKVGNDLRKLQEEMDEDEQ